MRSFGQERFVNDLQRRFHLQRASVTCSMAKLCQTVSDSVMRFSLDIAKAFLDHRGGCFGLRPPCSQRRPRLGEHRGPARLQQCLNFVA